MIVRIGERLAELDSDIATFGPLQRRIILEKFGQHRAVYEVQHHIRRTARAHIEIEHANYAWMIELAGRPGLLLERDHLSRCQRLQHLHCHEFFEEQIVSLVDRT